MPKSRHYYASPDYDTHRASTPSSVVDVTAPAVRSWSEWEQDCLTWRGLVLEGQYAHWCPQWEDLPMDETCPEWPCACEIEPGLPDAPSGTT